MTTVNVHNFIPHLSCFSWKTQIYVKCPKEIHSHFTVIGRKTVREITKSSSTFSATNISSNIAGFLQLHDTIQMKSNHKQINYRHDDIAINSHIMIDNFVWNLIFVTKFSSIYLAKGEKRLVFRQSFVNLQRAKDGTHMFDAKYRYVFVVQISSNRTLGIMPH